MSDVAMPRRPLPKFIHGAIYSGLLCVMMAGGSIALAATEAVDGLVARPLTARSGPRGTTMFTELPPAQTGISTTNNYADPRMWTERYQEFVYGAIGSGAAIGDYDNDGLPDVFVVSKTEGCQLFRNLGGWRFEDVTERAGVSSRVEASWTDAAKSWLGLGDAPPDAWKQGATFVDVNNDGRLDLYVCRFGVPNLLFLNQGDGTFREAASEAGLAFADASNMAAFADYDRDGWLDVYLQTNLLDSTAHPGGQRDRLFRNNGDGTFTDVTDRAGISGETQGHSATWWDYDNDGWPDLYVANDFAPADSLYHNNRDGTFTNVIDRVVPHTPHSSMGADLADVNNDGLIDLLVADMAATSHLKDHRGMAKIRRLLDEHETESSAAPQYMRSALYLNTGTPRVLEAAYLAGLEATDWTWSVRFEDLDNDGKVDAHFTNGMVRELHNTDLVQRMSASESLLAGYKFMKASPSLAETNLAYRNLGDLRFERIESAWGLGQRGVSFAAAFGDLDGDGDLDLVQTNYEQGATVLRNDSADGHRIVVALRGTRSNSFGVGATVRIETADGVQVRQLVLARGYLASSEPVLHFGLGSSDRVDRLTVVWPSGRVQTFSDVRSNQHLTITEPRNDVEASLPPSTATAPLFSDASEAAGFSLLTHDDREPSLNREALLPLRQDRRGPALAVSDLDGDGIDDVVVGGTTKESAQLLKGDGAAFQPSSISNAGGANGPVLVFEADGDGANDLLLTSAGQGSPMLLLNKGAGLFHPANDDALSALTTVAGTVAAADFDRDGRLDVFIGGRAALREYPLPSRSGLLVNRGGRFEDVTDAVAPGLGSVGIVNSALWTDVDGDGWIDLLLALEWGGVVYWRNDGGKRFEDCSRQAGFAAGGVGWWTSLAAADFNGDGRMDYAAGNVGLNTPYRASPVQPALLLRGSFTPGGPPLIIEGYHEDDRLYPRRSRQDLGAKIPTILRRFPRHDAYAEATLGELLGEDRLGNAQRFEATQLQSGAFLSQPDGTFRFEPFPRVAQISPLQGMVAGDFDGDGHADVYAVQNSYAPIPSIGRFDGGLSQLLLGNGRGDFRPVPPRESGLVVPGDAKALAVADFDRDGWPDFLVTRNNATTMAWRNERGSGRHSFRVLLRGPLGNPHAVGAQLVLELADGSRQPQTVHAGSGYYSQSAPGAFFGFPDNSRPRRLEVRWPDGTATIHAFSSIPPATLVLSLP